MVSNLHEKLKRRTAAAREAYRQEDAYIQNQKAWINVQNTMQDMRISSPYLGVSDSIKIPANNFIQSANTGFANNGALANTAIQNARSNGLTTLADSLQSQMDVQERARQVAEWEAGRSISDLENKNKASQAELDELFRQRQIYYNTIVGSDEVTAEQREELRKINDAIKKAMDDVEYYSLRSENKQTSDWMERNLAEIRQAEQEAWNPQDRQRHLDRLLSVSLPEADLTNPTAIARREREIDVLNTDLLGRLREATHNPGGRNQLTKELMAHGYTKKQIASWFDYAERLESDEDAQKTYEKWREKGADMRVGQAFRRSTFNNLLGGLGAVSAWGQKIENAVTGKDTPIDYNNPLMRPSIKAQAIREGKSADIEERTKGWIGSNTGIGNLYSAAFNLGASMADSAAIAGLTALGVPAWAGTLALGSSAAASTMREASERGLPEDRALLLGTITGLAEWFFEKYSVESLIDNINNPETVRQLLTQAAVQGGIEASEEGLTTIVNTLADMLISGDYSEYEITKRNYMEAGFSETEAAKKASSDWLKGMSMDLVGGFISGGTMTAVPGSVKLAINSKNTQKSTVAPVQNTMGSQVAAAMADMKTTEQRIAEDLGGMSSPVENKTAPVNDPGAVRKTFLQNVETKIRNKFGITSFNDYVGVQKKVTETLQNDGFFGLGSVQNENNGIVVDITKDGIRETFGSGKRFQTLPKTIKLLKFETLPKLRELIRTATMSNDDVSNIHNSNSKVKYAYLKNTFESDIDGTPKTYNITIVVRKSPQKNKFWMHEIHVNQEEQGFGLREGMNPAAEVKKSPVLGDNVSEEKPIVNPENVGDMGAMTSKFSHVVVKSQTNAIDNQRDAHAVPKEYRTEYTHTRVSEDESMYGARLRLEQDRSGEQEYLSDKTQWNSEDYDTAMLILDDLAKTAHEQGTKEAWDEYAAWEKVIRLNDYEAGSALQARAKWARRTGTKIIQRASEHLENAKKSTDVAEIMNSVSDYATQLDVAISGHDVDAIRKIIKDTSATRHTGTLRKNEFSKQMNWALDRISEYAKNELKSLEPATEGNGEYRVGRFYDFLEDFAASGIEAIASDKSKVSLGKKNTTYQRLAMLSKMSTVMRNLVNNGILDPLDVGANNVSAIIDSAVSAITKTRSVAFEKVTSKEKRQGSLDALAMAMLSVGLDVNAEGVSGKYQSNSNRTWHMSNGPISRFMSQWEKYMGYAMVATDEFSKGGIQAEVQRGIDRLYEQGKIKDDSLKNAGDELAKYRTLQKEGTASELMTKIRGVVNDVSRKKTGNAEIELGTMLMPFAQVPANVPGVMADYSPIGLTKGVFELAKVFSDAKKGTLTASQQASAVRDIGRGLTGSALIKVAIGLAKMGLVKVFEPGGEEEDKNKAADQKASGIKGTQWNISATLRAIKGESSEWKHGDYLVSIGFLEPLNAFLTAGALIAQSEDMTGGEIFSASLDAIIEAYSQLPMFQTIGDAINAGRYSDESTIGGKVMDGAEQLAAGVVTGLIPNAVKGIAQGLDPYQRDLYSGDTFGERVRDQFRGVFNRDALPIKQDVYGNDMKNENRFLNFMNSNILPGAITTYKETDLQKALRDLEAQTGSTAGYLSKNAPTSVNTEKGDVELTDKQKSQFVTDRGNIYEMASSALENSDLFKGLPANIQQKTYGYAENYATQTAKENLNIGFKPDDIAADLDNPTSQELLDALLLKTFNSMAGNTKVYGDKYQGYADLLKTDTINDRIALDLISNTRREVYENTLRGAGVSVQQWLDVLSVAIRKQGNYVGEKPTKQQREDAWAHIDKMNLTDKQRAALETAVGQVFGYVIVKDATRK